MACRHGQCGGRWLLRRVGAAWLFALFLFQPLFYVQAEGFGDAWFDGVALHAGQGVGQGLETISRHLVSEQLVWDPTYVAVIQLHKVSQVRDEDDTALLAMFVHAYELNLVQHSGLQHNGEVAVAYTLRTPDFHLYRVYVNLAIGVGLSYALGKPSYEDGAAENPAKRYRLQLFLPIELAWHMPAYHRYAVVTRIHHRSGIYGLIAPKGVGSNFLTLGLRYTF